MSAETSITIAENREIRDLAKYICAKEYGRSHLEVVGDFLFLITHASVSVTLSYVSSIQAVMRDFEKLPLVMLDLIKKAVELERLYKAIRNLLSRDHKVNFRSPIELEYLRNQREEFSNLPTFNTNFDANINIPLSRDLKQQLDDRREELNSMNQHRKGGTRRFNNSEIGRVIYRSILLFSPNTLRTIENLVALHRHQQTAKHIAGETVDRKDFDEAIETADFNEKVFGPIKRMKQAVADVKAILDPEIQEIGVDFPFGVLKDEE